MIVLIQNILERTLSKYFTNFHSHYLQKTKNQQGHLSFKYPQELHFDTKFINMYRFPLQISSIKISYLQILVSGEYFSSLALEINIRNIEMVIVQLPQSDWIHFIKRSLQQKRRHQIDDLCKKLSDRVTKGLKGIQRLIMNISNRMKATLENINIRLSKQNKQNIKNELELRIKSIELQNDKHIINGKQFCPKQIVASDLQMVWIQQYEKEEKMFSIQRFDVCCTKKQERKSHTNILSFSIDIQELSAHVSYGLLNRLTNLVTAINRYTRLSEQIMFEQDSTLTSQEVQQISKRLNIQSTLINELPDKTVYAVKNKIKDYFKQKQKHLPKKQVGKQEQQNIAQLLQQLTQQQREDKKSPYFILSVRIRKTQIVLGSDGLNFEGAVYVAYTHYGALQFQEVNSLQLRQHSHLNMDLSKFSIYLKRNNLNRYFLQPSQINIDSSKYYIYEQDIKILQTAIQFKASHLLIDLYLQELYRVITPLRSHITIEKYIHQHWKEQIDQISPWERASFHNYEEYCIKVQMKKLEEKFKTDIQRRIKVVGKTNPIKIQIFNDYNNLAPMVRLFIDSAKPAIKSNIINLQIFIVSLLSVHFFNLRSLRWEPIIEPFKSSFSYSLLSIGKQNKLQIGIKADESEYLSSLRINISTQLLQTTLAAFQFFQSKSFQKLPKEQIEQSPFIFHNMTNQPVSILTGVDKDFKQLQPKFKGRVSIANEKQIVFKMAGVMHKINSDHYGVIRVPNTNYFLQFDNHQLNRVIRFMPSLLIRNNLQQQILIKVIRPLEHECQKNKQNQLVNPIKVKVGELLSLDGIQIFVVLLNKGKERKGSQQDLNVEERENYSFSQLVATQELKSAKSIMGQKNNFYILVDYVETLNKYGVVTLLPPFIIYNCLPKNISLQFLQKAKLLSTKSLKAYQSRYIHANKKFLQVKVKTGQFSWSQPLKFNPEKNNTECQLFLINQYGAQITINYIFKRESSSNQYALIIYCKCFIQNQTEHKLVLFDQQQRVFCSKRQLSQTQEEDRIMLISSQIQKKVYICSPQLTEDQPDYIRIQTLGSFQTQLNVSSPFYKPQRSLPTKVVMQIKAVKMRRQCDVVCKKIVLRDKHIVRNNSRFDLIITNQEIGYELTINANSQRSLSFENPNSNYVIKAMGYEQTKLKLPTKKVTFFKLHAQQSEKQDICFKLTVEISELQLLYEINQTKKDDYLYQIIVNSHEVTIEDPSKNQAYKDKIIIYQNEKAQILQDLQLKVIHNRSKKLSCFTIELEAGEHLRQTHTIYMDKKEILTICAYVLSKGRNKCIIIDQVQKEHSYSKQVQKSIIDLSIGKILLSFNHNSCFIPVPFESLLLAVGRLQLIRFQTDKKVQYQIKVGYLQVDQMYPHILPNPVIMFPSKYQEYVRQENPRCILNFIIQFNNHFSYHHVNSIKVDISDFVLNFTAEFLTLATIIIDQNKQLNLHHKKYKANPKSFLKTKISQDNMSEISTNRKIYVQQIKISPFVIDLIVQFNKKKLNLKNYKLLSNVVQTIGFVSSNLDRAPLKIKGLELKGCCDTPNGIINKLTLHYQSTCVNQFYRIFGGLNIIGSPLRLLQHVSVGVKDIVEKSSQGFVKGPVQFGLGIAKGTKSLLKHSVGGTFQSISLITGSVSSGLSALTFDKSFQEHRERQKNKKSHNVLQGLEKGGKALLYGFKEGITGVFTKPIEGARQGALGLVKGAAKGIAGLLIKPVTGVIDFATNTTEGLKNNVLTQDGAGRTRFPRVFYSQHFILKEYSQIDSELYNIIRKAYSQKSTNPIFVDALHLQQEQFLVVLQSSVAYVDRQKHRIQWEIDYSSLVLSRDEEKKVLVFEKKGGSSFLGFCQQEKKHEVYIEDEYARQMFAGLIETLIQRP